MKKVKVGKTLLQIVLTALIASVILTVTNWGVGLISFAGVFNSFLIAVVSVIFFIWAIKINPGNEEFLTTIPIAILSIAIIDLARNWATFIPSLVIPFTFIGMAFGFGSVFLATMITKKYIIK